MSDIQRDREERQHVIEVLKSWDGYFIGYTSDEVQEALSYAIASIKTDLKYDLLYEETSGQADKPTTKNDLGVDCISRTQAIERLKLNFPISQGADNSRDRHRYMQAQADLQAIRELPPVTPQLSSGLEKNSKKLEKDFGELDCISRAEVLKLMQDNWHSHNGDWAMQESMDDIRALPSVTPQEPKVDWDELKRKIFMEVDGGTDDKWLRYADVCDRISNSTDEFVADMRGNAKRKGEPIEGNNESYNCENWIP